MASFELAVRLLQRTGRFDPSSRLCCVSVHHRRALAVQVGRLNWLSIKGVGWVHGPPWAVLSPKDQELCFGVMDGYSALREVQVSYWLRGHNCDVTNCLDVVPLSVEDLAIIGVQEYAKFRNGRLIEPVALVTQCRSALRVSDWTPRLLMQWQRELESFFGAEQTDNGKHAIVFAFARHLARTIRQYHALGAVNDTLAPDNVTIAGEITDFEWFYVPGIPLPDGTTAINLSERQAKEAIYLIDILLSLTEGLSLDISISDLAAAALLEHNLGAIVTPFDQQLLDLCVHPL